MKLLVIGATGRTGRLIVDRAVAAGHHVVAFVRSPGKLAQHPFPAGVDVLPGDVLNPSSLERAMQGCQSVINAIGGKTPWKTTTLERSAAAAILEAMDRTGTRRLLVISVLGAGESAAQAGFFYRHILMPTFLRGDIPDKNAMEAQVSASPVDWTLVRPPILTNAGPTGHILIVPRNQVAHKLTRADLAQFLIDQLTSSTYSHQAVTIANR